jgi:hypothetical protein
MKPNHDEVGLGATEDLRLRVSVATLVRAVFTSTQNTPMLVLERKATFHEGEQQVIVKAQPFGGAVRIHDLARLHDVTGGFHFDSQRSYVEQDFRILIRPSAWEAVKAFCLDQFQASEEAAFEISPVRELAEELHDSLGIQVNPDQYACQPLWTALESDPIPTGNIHAARQPTVRIYRVFEARILDARLAQEISFNSSHLSDQDLRRRALEDLRKGGPGQANACLALPLESLPPERNASVSHASTMLEDNVSALLDSVSNSRFEYILS